MGAASFYGGVRHKRYSGQPDPEGHAIKKRLIFTNLILRQSIVISTKEKSPQVTRQRLRIFYTEFLAKISPSSK
ncbi:hypothetical protein DBB36_14015 [Flavobacterium sp. WLB]|nr:hypothetical protein AKO67_09495 [Flavobacterium sp. VMW]OWU89963.1 hypothetical protein APR43_14725 [Flavobacterium sp. NLM]PUU69399.1 hypothetical protein DBB36_14015 [Flavobacterium sp. WLB]